jgi:hypothetical protein
MNSEILSSKNQKKNPSEKLKKKKKKKGHAPYDANQLSFKTN